MAFAVSGIGGCKNNEAPKTEIKGSVAGDSDLKSLLQANMPENGDEIAVITTDMGVIKVRFFPEQAPKAVENFITHAKAGYFNNIKFHRIVSDFMIQSGDPTGTGSGGDSIWGEPFELEADPNLFNFRGALAMARQSGNINSNKSQFFIVQNSSVHESQVSGYTGDVKEAYLKYGGSPHLDGDYTVFGQVIEGMDVADKISAEAGSSTNAGTPKKTVNIQKVEIVEYNQ